MAVSAVVSGQGHAGEEYNNILILNKFMEPSTYYVKIHGAIGVMEYSSIIEGKTPDRIINKLNKNPYIHLVDGTTLLYDVHGLEIKIDTIDFELVRNTTWSATLANDNYVVGNIKDEKGNRVKKYLHQVICGIAFDRSKIQVDHIDLDVLNNKRSNLRICDNRFNNSNKKIHQDKDTNNINIISSGKGYKAVIKYNSRSVHLGSGTLEQMQELRDLVLEYIESGAELDSELLSSCKKQIGILSENAENNAYVNNALGLKGIRMDKRTNTYQVRLNFRDGRGTVYCGSRKSIDEAIRLRDTLLKEFINKEDK